MYSCVVVTYMSYDIRIVVLLRQVKLLFPNMSPRRRNRLRFDEEALWSVTDQPTADEVSLLFFVCVLLFFVCVFFRLC